MNSCQHQLQTIRQIIYSLVNWGCHLNSTFLYKLQIAFSDISSFFFFCIGLHSQKIIPRFMANSKYLTSRPAWARAVVIGRFHALRILHKIMFWFGVRRTSKLYFSITSLNVFFIFPPIRPLSTWSPQNKPPSPCQKFSNNHGTESDMRARGHRFFSRIWLLREVWQLPTSSCDGSNY